MQELSHKKMPQPNFLWPTIKKNIKNKQQDVVKKERP